MLALIEMPLTRRLVPLVMAIIVILAAIELIRRRKLREEYAMLWLTASVALLVFAIFPGIVLWLQNTLQVNYLTIIVLSCFLFLAMILMHMATIISRQAEQIRRVAEQIALMDNVLARKAAGDPQAPAPAGTSQPTQPPPGLEQD
jgi:hypothetical protein